MNIVVESVFLRTLVAQNRHRSREVEILAILPLAAVKRVIKENANIDRVGSDGVRALAELMEDEGTRIAQRAVLLAKHAGRKTVVEEDIKLATKYA
jgi:histone H3/H4